MRGYASRAAFCIALAFGALLAPSIATAQVSLSTTPALYPAFNPAVHDYVTRCTGSAVQVHVIGDATRRVGVDGDAPRGGSFTRGVPLLGSQGFAIVVANTSGVAIGTYRVRCLPTEFPGFTSARTGTTQASAYIVTPSQSFTPPPPGTSGAYTAIFDRDGAPTWWFKSPISTPVDSKLLPNGNVAWSIATGGAEERKLDGQLVRSLNTYPFASDLHDLLLLPNGHYLLMAYVPTPGFDLTPIGGANPATIIDAVIQEIDPSQSGAASVVWTWRASDHIDASQVAPRWRTVVQLPSMFGTNDIYHINSFERDGNDYIISLRALDAVFRINDPATDGTMEWKLGGTNLPGKSLSVVGDPKVDPEGPLAGQHDARLLANGDLTVNDNGAYFDGSAWAGPPPRSVRYEIDGAAKTATWVEQVTDSLAPASLCCGSSRQLAGGNWVMSWGGTPIVTELTPDGSRVFKLEFNAPMFSYRAAPVLAGELSAQALQTGMDVQHPRRELTLSGASGAFGTVRVRKQSAPQTFTVANTGQGPVQVAATALIGADATHYALSGCAAGTLSPGASCQATVRFKPTSTGAHAAATLRVTSNAASGPNVAGLSGTGAPLPSNRFTIPKPKVSRTGTVRVRLSLPGPGKVAALETMRASALRAVLVPGTKERTIGRASRTVSRAGNFTIRVRLNSRGRRQLRRHDGRLRVRLTMRFKPTGGNSRTRSRRFTLKVNGL